jgi:ribosomal protein S18 acetylase RimI-like enzyme
VTDDLKIRRATGTDAELLADLGARTFAETFGPDNTPEDIAAHISATFTPAVMSAELADPRNVVLIAEIDGTACGYAKLRWHDAHEGVGGERPAQLSRIYVDSAWHGRSVGPALMQRCIDEAMAAGADVLWLGVWERNDRARAFYARSGFEKVAEHDFMLGSDRQTDWVMALRLSRPAVDGIAGNSDNLSRD